MASAAQTPAAVSVPTTILRPEARSSAATLQRQEVSEAAAALALTIRTIARRSVSRPSQLSVRLQALEACSVVALLRVEDSEVEVGLGVRVIVVDLGVRILVEVSETIFSFSTQGKIDGSRGYHDGQ